MSGKCGLHSGTCTLYNIRHLHICFMYVLQAEKEESSARDLKDMLLGHCHEVLDSRPSAAALSTVAYLTLVDMIQG